MKKQMNQAGAMAKLQDAALSHDQKLNLKGGVYILQAGDTIIQVLDPITNFCRIRKANGFVVEDLVAGG